MNDPEHALTPYLHVPLQSGSDQILSAMRRKYTAVEYVDFLNRAADRVPNAGFGTDIMVGFPGETDDDFAATLDVLRDSSLHYAHVFKYSEREGTASARMSDTVAPDVVNRRSAVLRAESARQRQAFYESRMGTVADVVFECEENGFWTGYTEQYVRVAVRSDEPLKNERRRVRLDGIVGDLARGMLIASPVLA
jgi:threonylcarbamoyladenosine tRNA methylthiotransferase MtaB